MQNQANIAVILPEGLHQISYSNILENVFPNLLLSYFNCLEKFNLFLSSVEPTLVIFVINKNEFDIENYIKALSGKNYTSPLIAICDDNISEENTQNLYKLNFDEILLSTNTKQIEITLKKYDLTLNLRNKSFSIAGYELFSTLLNNLTDGVIRYQVYPTRKIYFVNRAMESLTGFAEDEFYSDSSVMQRIIKPDDWEKYKNFITSNQPIDKTITLKCKRKDGTWFWANLENSLFFENNRLLYIDSIVRDVSQDVKTNNLQQSIYDIARITNSNLSLKRIFIAIHKTIEKILKVENIYIALFNEIDNQISFPYFIDKYDYLNIKDRPFGNGLTEFVIKTGQTLFATQSDITVLANKGLVSIIGTPPLVWLGVPLLKEEKAIGVLVVQSYSNSNAFDDEDRKILEYVSSQIAITIDFKNKNERIKLLSEAVEQSPISIVITNLSGNLIYVNKTFSDITGYSTEEVLGKNPSILQSGKTPKDTYDKLWESIVNGEIWSGEFVNQKKDGTIFYESSTIVPITDEFGKVVNYLGIKQDITEHKNLINELITAKDKALESDGLKTAFLQNISHEIRTPMNAIMGFAELLESDHDDEEQISYYTSVIKQRSFDLLDIINELLDIAKIDSGQLKSEVKPFNINALFDDLRLIFENYRLRFQKSSVSFNISHYNLDNSIIIADESKLRQVFSNLIQNSIKFTNAGNIEYGFHKIENNRIVFKVADTGVGIADEMKNLIFHRFRKSITETEYIQDGLGLGLSIVRGLVDLMDGEIYFESTLSVGTTFFISIPYIKQIKPETETINVSKYFEKISVFVVEDDAFNASYFNELLDSFNIQFEIASTGQEAIDKFRKNPNYKLVLMDIKLPDISGYEVIEEFKIINPQIKIIAQTAYASEADKIKAHEAGCVDFIAKPIFRDKLLELIEKHSE